jgi:hypothetical protein
MANLLKRLQSEEKQPSLNVYEPEVVVEGSIVTCKFDMAKVSEIAVERDGERTMQNGTTKKYMKNPAIMLRLIIPEIELEVTDDAGQRHLLGAKFSLGQGGNGAYATLSPTEDYGIINAPKVPATA